MKLTERLRIGDNTGDDGNTSFLEISSDGRRYMPNVSLAISKFTDGVETKHEIGVIQTTALIDLARVLHLMKKITAE